MQKIEIIAPITKKAYLTPFFQAGADAVYAGLKNLTWYHNSIEFTWDELIELSHIIHTQQKKLYIAINRNLSTSDVEDILKHARLFEDRTFDAAILADWGCIAALRKYFTNIEIHLSANALCTDYSVFDLAQHLKIQRIVFSPSLQLHEMQEIINRYQGMEWESVIAGSRCYNEVGFCKCYITEGNTIHKELCRKSYYLYQAGKKALHKAQIWGYPLLDNKAVRDFFALGIVYWKIEGRDRNSSYLVRTIRDLRHRKDLLEKGIIVHD